MRSLLSSSLAALAGGLLLAGCVAAPYGYGYGYDRPYYYDQGPYYGYYDYGPYSYYYGPPAFYGGFRFGAHDHGNDRHWNGGSWHRESLTQSSGTTTSHPAQVRSARNVAPKSHASTHARMNRSTMSQGSSRSAAQREAENRG
jgi:hypothetical protein